MTLDRVIAVRNNKTVYRDGERCIKVFSSRYSKADILNEALNQARIEETGLNVPKVLEVTVIEGKWSIVSEYIKGKTLAQLMEENPEKKEQYLQLLVQLQLQVHSKTAPLLTKLKDKLTRKIAQSGFDAAVRGSLQARLEAMPKQTRVCHGDFNPSNIIITDGGVPYIVDWSHAAQGNSLADVACTYLLLCLRGDEEGAKRYLDIFCQASGTEPQEVYKWLPMVAAAKSVRGNEQQRRQLCGWVLAQQSKEAKA